LISVANANLPGWSSKPLNNSSRLNLSFWTSEIGWEKRKGIGRNVRELSSAHSVVLTPAMVGE
jgi:hypothetical protein